MGGAQLLTVAEVAALTDVDERRIRKELEYDVLKSRSRKLRWLPKIM